jgi:hypothetical protein
VNSVIPVGFTLEWSFPVIVRDREIRDRPIVGPRAALKYLHEDLAIRSGRTYWQAVGACNDALRYRGDIDDARNSFIAAYAECMTKLSLH